MNVTEKAEKHEDESKWHLPEDKPRVENTDEGVVLRVGYLRQGK